VGPWIVRDIGRAVRYLPRYREIAIVLVEQSFDFAHESGDAFVVLGRGEVVLAGAAVELAPETMRGHLTP
jgi:urea transport system ATP-binding protein